MRAHFSSALLLFLTFHGTLASQAYSFSGQNNRRLMQKDNISTSSALSDPTLASTATQMPFSKANKAESARDVLEDIPMPIVKSAAVPGQPTGGEPVNTASVGVSAKLPTGEGGSTASKSNHTSMQYQRASDAALDYAFVSKKGTSFELFENFATEIDNKKGILYQLDGFKKHIYITNMKGEQAADILKKYDFIDSATAEIVGSNDDDNNSEVYRALGPSKRRNVTEPEPGIFADAIGSYNEPILSKDHIVSRAIVEDSTAPWWKKMLSAPPRAINVPNSDPSHDPPAQADNRGGRGTTIYILDDGYDLSINVPDLQKADRKIETLVIPNYLTLPNLSSDEHGPRGPPEQIGGGGHGTQMASLAGGRVTGVAPNADLFLVKTKNKYRSPAGQTETWQTPPMQYRALVFMFDQIIQHINDRLEQDKDARSVISMSAGVRWNTDLAQGQGPAWQDQDLKRQAFQDFLDFLKEKQIPFVVAAGNWITSDHTKDEGVEFVHQNIPQRLSTPTDTMIIVGAVDSAGLAYADGSKDPTHLISVWAPGVQIDVRGNDGKLETDDGTSVATAIVAGVCAYYYGLEKVGTDQPKNWPPASAAPGASMKTIIQQFAWKRTNTAPSTNYAPNALKVVYNLARGEITTGQNPPAQNPPTQSSSAHSSSAHNPTVGSVHSTYAHSTLSTSVRPSIHSSAHSAEHSAGSKVTDHTSHSTTHSSVAKTSHSSVLSKSVSASHSTMLSKSTLASHHSTATPHHSTITFHHSTATSHTLAASKAATLAKSATTIHTTKAPAKSSAPSKSKSHGR